MSHLKISNEKEAKRREEPKTSGDCAGALEVLANEGVLVVALDLLVSGPHCHRHCGSVRRVGFCFQKHCSLTTTICQGHRDD